MKKRINISVDEVTVKALKNYAKTHHTTVSQTVTDLIWKEVLRDEKEYWKAGVLQVLDREGGSN